MRTLKEMELAAMLEGDLDSYSPTMTPNEQTDRLPYNMEYEFPRERIMLQEQLGEGAFGIVVKGKAIGIVEEETETTVAVKMVKKKYDIEALQALVAELKIMIHLGQHLNVVNLLGAITKNIGKRELMVIVEYCPFGNVLNILRNNRSCFIDEINQQSPSSSSKLKIGLLTGHSVFEIGPTTSRNTNMLGSSGSNSSATVFERSISTTDLICWAFQVATGMDYVASRKVLHGDLAARNVLLCNDNVVKICDFGLSRSLYNGDKYKKSSKSPLPVRWVALECFSDGLFSTHSDVWSYGIFLWELFSLGMVPYPGIEMNSDFYKMLRDGLRMECPPFSNQDIYDIMLSCWKVKPDTRPSFKELRSHFSAMLVQETQDYYLALNEPYLALNNARMVAYCTEYLSPETDVHLVSGSEGRAGKFVEMATVKEFGGYQNLTTDGSINPASTNHNKPEYVNECVLNNE
ncbi:vascular endothelial growth factor receptor 1-like [Anopheles darlingi]|uniref:vascular endothelial growth factor receptor 1-like n=1 Tax=Anopheles darlingi TaxID=43151 RepID=UPI002100352E|nr:vascular endothelial growth factor receptor 1-like [Anopheles darlingi]